MPFNIEKIELTNHGKDKVLISNNPPDNSVEQLACTKKMFLWTKSKIPSLHYS